MTTPHLAQDISRDEGLRLHAYPDPLSGAEPWTCGYGCTGSDIGPGTVWTAEVADERRDQEIAEACADLDRDAPWWRSLCDARQDVLVNMTYNMGWRRLSGFHHALAAMQAHDYATAAAEMINSGWDREVGSRATRLAEQMRTGIRA